MSDKSEPERTKSRNSRDTNLTLETDDLEKPMFYNSLRYRVVRYIILLYTYMYPFSLLDTVNFTECDPISRITTQWVSDSVSPLSDTDDVVLVQSF